MMVEDMEKGWRSGRHLFIERGFCGECMTVVREQKKMRMNRAIPWHCSIADVTEVEPAAQLSGPQCCPWVV